MPSWIRSAATRSSASRPGRDGRRLQGARPGDRAHGRDQDHLARPLDDGSGRIRGALLPGGAGRGRLNHPNIVTIYDVGKSGDVIYMAMEFIEGVAARPGPGRVLPPGGRRHRGAGRRGPRLRASSTASCTATSSPPTSWCCTTASAKITDFGIARLPTGIAHADRHVFGSPKYMSPEQVMGSASTTAPTSSRSARALRDADRQAAVHRRRHHLGHVPDPQRGAAGPEHGEPGGPADARFHRGEGARQDPGGPLCEPRRKWRRIVRRFREFRGLASRRCCPSMRRATPLAAPPIPHRVRPVVAASDSMLLRPERLRRASPSPVSRAAGRRGGRVASRQRRNVLVYVFPSALSARSLVRGRCCRSARRIESSAAAAPANEVRLKQSRRESAPATAGLPRSPNRNGSQSLAASQPAAAPEARAGRCRRKSRPSPPSRWRALGLAVTPWGEVYVDGKKRGISPPLTELRTRARKTHGRDSEHNFCAIF